MLRLFVWSYFSFSLYIKSSKSCVSVCLSLRIAQLALWECCEAAVSFIRFVAPSLLEINFFSSCSQLSQNRGTLTKTLSKNSSKKKKFFSQKTFDFSSIKKCADYEKSIKNFINFFYRSKMSKFLTLNAFYSYLEQYIKELNYAIR